MRWRMVAVVALVLAGVLAGVVGVLAVDLADRGPTGSSCRQTTTSDQYDQAGHLVRSVARVEDCAISTGATP